MPFEVLAATQGKAGVGMGCGHLINILPVICFSVAKVMLVGGHCFFLSLFFLINLSSWHSTSPLPVYSLLSAFLLNNGC